MAYLQHLKTIYQTEYRELEYQFNNHCEEIIYQDIKLDFKTIKQQIERDIFESMTYRVTKDSIVIVDIELLCCLNLTNLFEPKYHPLFVKLLNNHDTEGIGNFIESLDSFQGLKKLIEKELDGLTFEFQFSVELDTGDCGHNTIQEICIHPRVTFKV